MAKDRTAKARKAAHSPEARRKAVETMKRNREAKLALAGKGGGDIPLDAIPTHGNRRVYDEAFRRKAVAMLAQHSAEEVGRQLGIPSSSVIHKWKKHIEDGGTGIARERGPRGPRANGAGVMSTITNLRMDLRHALEQRDAFLEAAASIVETYGPSGNETQRIAKQVREFKSNKSQ